jgi:anti-sigma regulatory factor (Ser/Thr protein kinase)
MTPQRIVMKNAVTLKIALPRIPDIELVAIEGLDRLARHLGIAEEKIGEAKVLVTEAVINALEHAGQKNPTVRVEFTMTTEELSILVRDYGSGFAPTSVEEPLLEGKLGSKNKRGWGLKLMKSLSDDFRIDSDRNGTKITIKKLLR